MAKTAQAVIETKVKDGASAGFRNMQKEMNRTANQGKVLNQQFRFMRGGLGQVGHQVQDVAVQLQMGQNAMLVFGQQGSQIASLFGPGGAMFGAVIAIGAALSMSLAPALFGATEAAKELKDANKDLIDSFDELSPSQQKFAKILATKKLQEYEAELKKINETTREQMTTVRTGSFGIVYGSKDLETLAEYNERIAKLDSDTAFYEAAIAALKEKVDNTTTAFEKQDATLKKQIETFGLEGHALREVGIEADLAANKITQTEADKLIARSETLNQLEIDAAREKEIINQVAEEQKKAAKVASDAIKAKQRAARQFADGFASSFTNAITTANNFKDAMRMVAKSVVDSLIKMIIQKQIADAIFNIIPASFGGGKTSTATTVSPGMTDFSPGIPVEMIANGGGFTGHGSRSGGVDGKGGFGAILHPNETVIDHTKGQSMGGVVVNQSINITTGVQQTVRSEIQNLMPQITEATKSAVANAKMRGGNFSKSLVGS